MTLQELNSLPRHDVNTPWLCAISARVGNRVPALSSPLRMRRANSPAMATYAGFVRAQLGGRICHRVTDPETAKMTLGDKFPEAVIAAQSIGPLERGVAITTTNEGGWLRARSANIGAEHAQRITTDYAHQRVWLPGLSDFDRPGGEAS